MEDNNEVREIEKYEETERKADISVKWEFTVLDIQPDVYAHCLFKDRWIYCLIVTILMEMA